MSAKMSSSVLYYESAIGKQRPSFVEICLPS